MKHLSAALALLSVLPLAVQANTVHVDISQDGKIAVDVDTDDARGSPNHIKGKPEDPDDKVEFYYEVHQGFETESGKYMNFTNIPYAEPPVGEFRWAGPLSPQRESDKINDGLKRAICPQFQVGWVPPAMEFVQDMLLDPVLDAKWKKPIGPDDYPGFKAKPELHQDSNEDCLNLDVLVPKKIWKERNSNKIYNAAVLVWIHGGGFIYGTKDEFGSPEHLLEQGQLDEDSDGFIFVSINYRLGAFGWLGGDKFMDDGGYPNAGLLDQKLALEWVQENIHKFGGDSRRITVMGQSAGASSILHHITADRYSKPVFQSAIIQSPGFFPAPNQSVHDETYTQFLKATGAKDLEELFKADTKVLMQANADMTYNSSYGLFKFGPTVDGLAVPDLPARRLKSGDYHRDVHIMAGHAKYDGLLFTPPWIRTDDQLRAHILTMYPGIDDSVLDEVKKTYPIRTIAFEKEKILQVSDFLDDIAIQCNTHYLAEAALKFPPKLFRLVFRYAFNTVPALHGADVPYTFYPSIKTKIAPNEEVAKYWQSAIANFTMYITPNDAEEDFWPIFSNKKREVMNIGSAGQWIIPNYKIEAGKDLVDAEKCAYWQEGPYYQPKERKVQNTIQQSRFRKHQEQHQQRFQQERMEM